jgi:hypothetical protein
MVKNYMIMMDVCNGLVMRRAVDPIRKVPFEPAPAVDRR